MARPDARRQNDVLYAFYLRNEVDLIEDDLKLNSAFGHAQRPPTLLERYADGLFISAGQGRFSRVYGDTTLQPERNWQIDLALTADYDRFRGRVAGYHSWIQRYITYQAFLVNQPAGFQDARSLFYINTEKAAQLFGFEASSEWDWSQSLSTIHTLRFNRRFNLDTRAALPYIFPLEGHLGLRWHDPSPENRWSIESTVRAVANQDRLGVVLSQNPTDLFETRTPGFSVWNIRGQRTINRNLKLTGGIDNLLNKRYLTHLDRRLESTVANEESVFVFSPGISPYLGLDWTF